MSVNEVAAKLYLEQKKTSDIVALLLKALSLVKSTELGLLYEVYNKCQKQEIAVVQVAYAGTLSQKVKTSIEKTIREQVAGEYIPLFFEDASLLGGFQLIIGDRLVDYSLLSKVIQKA